MLKLYTEKVVPALQEKLSIANVNAVPKLLKVVINVGVGKIAADSKKVDMVVSTVTRISGQKPVVTKARKSISNFKIRKGMGVGVVVTLRGRRMYEFLDKLVNVSLPRVRDFHGLSQKTFDAQGNYTIAFREHNVFPEIRTDEMDLTHGLQVTIATSAKTKEHSEALLRLLGFPIQS